MHVQYLQHSRYGTVQLVGAPFMSPSRRSVKATKSGEGANSSSGSKGSAPENTSGIDDEAAESLESGGNSDYEGQSESVPLPIQMFLWRQVSPFLGARNDKLHDSTCVTFERVVVQNILHGLSPSLSDAIASISRWRLVRAAFPYIVQCCGSLLAARAVELAEEPSISMPGSLVKMLYILHWLLMDAALECNENLLELEQQQHHLLAGRRISTVATPGELSIRHFVYPLSSVELFVYSLAPLFTVVGEQEIEDHIRLESGLPLWRALWAFHAPNVLCLSAPVKQRRSQFPSLQQMQALSAIDRGAAQSAAAFPLDTQGGIYVGEVPSSRGIGAHSASIRVVDSLKKRGRVAPSAEGSDLPTGEPPPKPPRSDVSVLRELELRAAHSSPQTPAATAQATQQQPCASGMVRSVSDYKTSELTVSSIDPAERLQKAAAVSVRKSQTYAEAFGHGYSRPTPGLTSSSSEDEERGHTAASLASLAELEQILHFAEGSSYHDGRGGGAGKSGACEGSTDTGSLSTSLFLQLDRLAPIVQLHDICSAASIELSGGGSVAAVAGAAAGQQHADERVRTPATSSSPILTPRPDQLPSREESLKSQQTVIAAVTSTSCSVGISPAVERPNEKQEMPQEERTWTDIDRNIEEHGQKPQAGKGVISQLTVDSGMRADEEQPGRELASQQDDPSAATYLDVAVLRCLLVRQWKMEGILWAVSYLSNRLSAIKIHKWSNYSVEDGLAAAVADAHGGYGGHPRRNRSDSVPALSTAMLLGVGPPGGGGSRRTSRVSRHDILADMDQLTWDALQQHRKDSLAAMQPIPSQEKRGSRGEASQQQYSALAGRIDEEGSPPTRMDTRGTSDSEQTSGRYCASPAALGDVPNGSRQQSARVSFASIGGLLPATRLAQLRLEARKRRFSMGIPSIASTDKGSLLSMPTTAIPTTLVTSSKATRVGIKARREGHLTYHPCDTFLSRSKSEPSITPSRAMALIIAMSKKRRVDEESTRTPPTRRKGAAAKAVTKVKNQKKLTPHSTSLKRTSTRAVKPFFPEATGSTAFIDRHGQLGLTTLLNIVELLATRICSPCSSADASYVCGIPTSSTITNLSPTGMAIVEAVLNVCDLLLNMPSTDPQGFFDSLLSIALRISLFLGCPNGCNDGLKSQQADFLRLKLKSLLVQMHRGDAALFSHILRQRIAAMPCQSLMDTLHSLIPFCKWEVHSSSEHGRGAKSKRTGIDADGGEPTTAGSSSGPDQRPREKRQQAPTYRNNFNEGRGGIETVCVSIFLSSTLSRLAAKQAELELPENMALYQDIRSFLDYAQGRHGQPLRRAALSALTAKLCSTPEEQMGSQASATIATNSVSPVPNKSHGTTHGKVGADEIGSTDRPSVRRNAGVGAKSTPVPTGKSSPSLTPPGSQQAASATPASSMRRGLFHRREKEREESQISIGSTATPTEESPPTPFDKSHSSTGPKQHGQQRVVVDEVQSDPIPTYPYTLPPRHLIALEGVREGVKRFSFLLRSSRPGQLPDAPLVGALMELRAPVLCRAALLLECASFVYRCNKGDWPEWSKSPHSIQQSGGGNATGWSATGNRGGAYGMRRVYQLQRAAGRNFYSWALQLSLRLREALGCETPVNGKENKRSLKVQDDLEDFLDDGTVNGSTNCQGHGDACPPALQMMACHLLLQITAFLRETFPSLPRSRIHKGAPNQTSGTGVGAGGSSGGSGWNRLMSHRRWSILSNTFAPGGAAAAAVGGMGPGSIVGSINDLHPGTCCERRVSYSTADESDFYPHGLGSPRGSKSEEQREAIQGASVEKKGRRLAQGRQRLLEKKRGSPTEGQPPAPQFGDYEPSGGRGGPRRRESIRLRKTSKHSGPSSSIRDRQYPRTTEETVAGVAEIADQTKTATKKGRSSADRLSEHLPSPSPPFAAYCLPASTSLVYRDKRKAVSLKKRLGLLRAKSVRLREVSQEVSRSTSPTTLSACASPVLSKQQRTRRLVWASESNEGGVETRTREPNDELGDEAVAEKRDASKAKDKGLRPDARGSKGAAQQPPLASTLEEEEEEMMRNMPWIRDVLVPMANRLDAAGCDHEPYCKKWCFQRVYRQCHRMIEALNTVYSGGTEAKLSAAEQKVKNRPDHKQQMLDEWRRRHTMVDSGKQTRASTTHHPRRESALTRQSGVERMPLALRGLLMEKLGEIEEEKALQQRTQATITAASHCPIDPSALVDVGAAPVLQFMRTQLLNPVHSPLSALLKSAVLLTSQEYKGVVAVSWQLLSHADPNVVSTAASMFICCAVKCADDCVAIMQEAMSNPQSADCRATAVRRFYSLWRHRFHVWLRMEEGAQSAFKVPPPGIDFTYPSPPIGQSQLAVVDPPWMSHMKTKVEELSLKAEEAEYSQASSQTIMTMTRTRRKQKQEMVKRAVREAEEKQCEQRQKFPLRAVAIVQQASYEPALFYHQVVMNVQQSQQQDSSPGAMANGADDELGGQLPPSVQQQQRQLLLQAGMMPVTQPLFPSSILSVVPTLLEGFNDVQVDSSGVAVGDVCRRVAWSCLVEDTSLFLRYFLEKLTNRAKQEQLVALLRELILSFGQLPSQMAHALLNHLFGLVMFYVRNPCDGSDKSLSKALSLAQLVCPFVHGLYFKDLKQTLRKEQCDQAIMITANVPSAKKIVVHGPEESTIGVPTQFPVHEETQFQQLLIDSIDFFNILDGESDAHFLMDAKTGVLHNPQAYVRDFYTFHRSLYPQLVLLCVENKEAAQSKLRRYAFVQRLIETNKVLLTHQILSYSPEAVIPQRIFFLHDELTHLPAFPRRSLESCFGMYQGEGGEELQSMDTMHKMAWAHLLSDIFEKMENAFMYGDLHLFVNAINGIMILHCEDVLILRRCMATYLTMAIRFNALFASQGFFLIMPTLLRCYSQRQTNQLFTQIVEFVCKQFYLLHRKPFLLQMFASVADICDQNNSELEINAAQVKAKYLFRLLLAMERMNDEGSAGAMAAGPALPLLSDGDASMGESGAGVDRLKILSLVPYPKPLKALDLCYRDDPDSFLVLSDAMASCVTVCAFAPESRRSHQCMLIMQAILPHYVQHLAEETQRLHTPAAAKHELAAYTTLCVEMRALLQSCDSLCRGPQRAFADISLAASNVLTIRTGGDGGGRGRSMMVKAESPQFQVQADPPTVMGDEDSTGLLVAAARMSQKRLLASVGWKMGGGESATSHQQQQQHGQQLLYGEIAQREMFRAPRDALLTLWAMFARLTAQRFKELARLSTVGTMGGNSAGSAQQQQATITLEHGTPAKPPDLLDHRCHGRLADVAVTLLKMAPYDPTTMGCQGLQSYFLHILPLVDWAAEGNRSALNVILRRLDKTIAKLVGKRALRRRANWLAIGGWLTGVYNTLTLFPYIAHLHPLKTTTQMCLRLIVGDPASGIDESGSTSDAGGYSRGGEHHQVIPTIIPSAVPPKAFCHTVLKLTAFLMQALGPAVFPLEVVCGPETLGATGETRTEALLCHLLVPIYLLTAVPGKDAINALQPRDLLFSLQLLQQAVNAPVAKQSLAATPVANLSSAMATSPMGGGGAGVGAGATPFIGGGQGGGASGGRQGSLSVVADRTAVSLVGGRPTLRDSLAQAVLLALKGVILAFNRQMGQHWQRVVRITRELMVRRSAGTREALNQFVDFLLDANLPVSLMLAPIVTRVKYSQRLQPHDPDVIWQLELRGRIAARLNHNSSTTPPSESAVPHPQLLSRLAQELQSMREEFSTRPLEPYATALRSPHGMNQASSMRTSGAGMPPYSGSAAEPSDSGSMHSLGLGGVRTDQPPQQRRVSSSTALGRIRASTIGQSSSTIHEEDVEAGGEHIRSGKSSLSSVSSTNRQRLYLGGSIKRAKGGRDSVPGPLPSRPSSRQGVDGMPTRLGMFRSVRWRRQAASEVAEEPKSTAIVMSPAEEPPRRTKSLRGIRKIPLSPPAHLSVTAEEGEGLTVHARGEKSITGQAAPLETPASGESRQRVVSFSTPHTRASHTRRLSGRPRRTTLSTMGDGDEEECVVEEDEGYYITSQQHLI